MPIHSSAQTQPSQNVVSVRELSIPLKAQRAFEQGLECLAKKDAAGSLVHFQQAIAEYAGYYEAYDRIGAADLKLWRVADAEQSFRKAIDLSGGQFAHPLIALGAILNDQEKFAEAESVTRKGLNLQPDSWSGHYYLGLALFGLNRLLDAEKSAREALHWKSDFPEAELLLADIHGREADYHSLVNDLDEYLKLAPDSPSSPRIRALRESVHNLLYGLQSSASFSEVQP
jgi:tetratricopeptide (TPR) repeat protein